MRRLRWYRQKPCSATASPAGVLKRPAAGGKGLESLWDSRGKRADTDGKPRRPRASQLMHVPKRNWAQALKGTLGAQLALRRLQRLACIDVRGASMRKPTYTLTTCCMAGTENRVWHEAILQLQSFILQP
jgi:hypothetical protein